MAIVNTGSSQAELRIIHDVMNAMVLNAARV